MFVFKYLRFCNRQQERFLEVVSSIALHFLIVYSSMTNLLARCIPVKMSEHKFYANVT